MVWWGTILLELALTAVILFAMQRVYWHKLNRGGQIVVLVLAFCATFISTSVSNRVCKPKRTLTVTALGEKSEPAEETSFYIADLILDGESQGVHPTAGQWTWNGDWYCWFDKGDERRAEGTTESVSFTLDVARRTELVLICNKWKGRATIGIDETEIIYDSYLDTEERLEVHEILPIPSSALLVRAILMPVLGFGTALLLLCVLFTLLAAVGQALFRKQLARLTKHGRIYNLLRYQFLFEELVKRDFKKKYKRTVLGMVWSVLSPLLTLLVMRVVFTQFFGRNVDHYTTYLFCGNLVFSYFSDATNQGMTSLMENANIFTKVNVPKYLFLFSKNIQTLINFCLTLCVFFVFCILDHISFTWRFVLLLYPIFMLVLFNIGVCLVLSAMFVFFRDIQYLWSVFTLLLMYMSAIFYTIDGYSYNAQMAFLVNPVYLFIRYFRKIVMDATIPTLGFHILMAADVLIMLVIGCKVYKKYNTKFLYYV